MRSPTFLRRKDIPLACRHGLVRSQGDVNRKRGIVSCRFLLNRHTQVRLRLQRCRHQPRRQTNRKDVLSHNLEMSWSNRWASSVN